VIMEGRAWVFGHSIDTDVITPGQYMASPVPEAAPHAFEAIDPEFAKSVQPGDIIVAAVILAAVPAAKSRLRLSSIWVSAAFWPKVTRGFFFAMPLLSGFRLWRSMGFRPW
jgi:hypothetical protein